MVHSISLSHTFTESERDQFNSLYLQYKDFFYVKLFDFFAERLRTKGKERFPEYLYGFLGAEKPLRSDCEDLRACDDQVETNNNTFYLPKPR